MIKRTLCATLLCAVAVPAQADGWLDTMIACNDVQQSKIPLVCSASRNDEGKPQVTFILHANVWFTDQDLLTNSMAEVTMPVCLQQPTVIMMILLTNDDLTEAKGNMASCANGELTSGVWVELRKNPRTGQWDMGQSS